MKTTLITALSALSLPLVALADDAPQDAATHLKVLLEATQNNDIKKFESVCDDKMKEAITPEVLAQVSKQVAPLMKAGYETDFMGDVDRKAYTTYYWKVDFANDQAPEMLAELSIANGKVAGFLIR